jgi:hypothetical protein
MFKEKPRKSLVIALISLKCKYYKKMFYLRKSWNLRNSLVFAKL